MSGNQRINRDLFRIQKPYRSSRVRPKSLLALKNLSKMDREELEEKYIYSKEANLELKKELNVLRDELKKLKARMRWPEHMQAVALSRELSERQAQSQKKLETSKNMLEARVVELSVLCDSYENQVQLLTYQLEKERSHTIQFETNQAQAAQVDVKVQSTPKTQPVKPSITEKYDAQILNLQRELVDWKQQTDAYKQRTDELTKRLEETQERLTQIMRLRTSDSAEMIRLARSGKLQAAQLTTIQDEGQRTKIALEQAQARVEDLSLELSREKQHLAEVQEEANQGHLLKQNLQDMTQEMDELKQERSMLRGQIKSLMSDVLSPIPAPPPEDSSLIEKLHGQIANLQRSLDEESAESKQLIVQLNKERSLVETLQKQIKAIKEEVSPVSSNEVETQDKAVQTIEEVAIKPPDVAAGLSAEESDVIMSQLHSEIEQHRNLMRTQVQINKLCQNEMESLRSQLKDERSKYSKELAELMAKLQKAEVALSQLKQNSQTLSVNKCLTSPDSVSRLTLPVPAPRKKNPDKVKEFGDHNTEENTKSFVLEIISLSATEGSPILSAGDFDFFIEFILPTQESETMETPGSYPRPTAPGNLVQIGHRHTWQLGSATSWEKLIRQAESESIHFEVVGEPLDKSDETLNCEDLGHADLQLKDVLSDDLVQKEIPLFSTNDESIIIGHITISLENLKTI